MQSDPIQLQRIELLLFWNLTLPERRIHFVAFFCIFNHQAPFNVFWVCETTYENTEPVTVRVASTCDYATLIFYIYEVFEVLSKLDVYVQGVRTIPEGFKIKLNTVLTKWWSGRENEVRQQCALFFSKTNFTQSLQ